jgi:sigma-B regulation protein RsbU (phosphoserine phosphatase)
MFAVHALSHYLAGSAGSSNSPAETLRKLNIALTVNNPTSMFVTMVHGIYDPRTGETVLASGGHPLPLLRRVNGRVDELPVPSGRALGFLEANPGLADARVTLAPGETMILYTDGFTEAFAPDGETMFGLERLSQELGSLLGRFAVKDVADKLRLTVEKFTGTADLQDDLTLLLLRRPC